MENYHLFECAMGGGFYVVGVPQGGWVQDFMGNRSWRIDIYHGSFPSYEESAAYMRDVQAERVADRFESMAEAMGW